jgi:hypothetical protein
VTATAILQLRKHLVVSIQNKRRFFERHSDHRPDNQRAVIEKWQSWLDALDVVLDSPGYEVIRTEIAGCLDTPAVRFPGKFDVPLSESEYGELGGE